jgi:hypothetical protein
VVLSTFPVAVPFIFMHNVAAAQGVSNFIANVMLFLTGYRLGRAISPRPVWVGIAMLILGVPLVALNEAGRMKPMRFDPDCPWPHGCRPHDLAYRVSPIHHRERIAEIAWRERSNGFSADQRACIAAIILFTVRTGKSNSTTCRMTIALGTT